MKSFDTDLLVLETSSVGYGFRALNLLTQTAKVRVLDASPSGSGRFVILISGVKSDLHAAQEAVRKSFEGQGRDEIVDHELIAGIAQDVLEAVFHLNTTALSESLVIVETKTASALLHSAQVLSKHGLKTLELKIHRAGVSGGVAYFTATTELCGPAAEDVRTHLRNAMREGSIEVIDQPTDAIRSLFSNLKN